jgi:hypothetical protein
MLARHSIGFTTVGILALAAGCSQTSGMFSWMSGGGSSAPVASAPQPATRPVDAAGAPADTPSADALAAKVNSYTQDVAPQLDRRNKGADAPATQPVSAIIARLDAYHTEPFSLTPYPQDAPAPVRREAPAAATDAAEGDAAAQQPTASAISNGKPVNAQASTGDANFPMIVPEGADQQAIPASATDAPMTADQAEHAAAQHLRDDPADLDGQLNYQLLMFVEGQPVPQMSALAGLRAEDREVISSLMDGLSNFRNVVRSSNNSLLADKVRPLVDMSDRLRSQAELTLHSVTLCTKVDSYGVYKAVDSDRFIAGRENQVIVYAEVENFQSQATNDNQWQTKLSEEMVLYTESGMPVWPAKSEVDSVVDLCHERRHDFFVAKLITLPQNLTIGRYLLKLTITDQEANRVAEATTPVEIVAE